MMSAHDDSSGGENDFAAMLAEFDGDSSRQKHRKVVSGQEVTGTIVSIGAESVFVDIGAKSEGVLERVQLADEQGQVSQVVGDQITARVVDDGDRSGTIVLRRGINRGQDVDLALNQAFQSRMPVSGTVTAVNKGGFDIDVAGTRAFCPISQIDSSFVEDGAAFVGQKLQFRITRLESEGKRGPNVVLSRRALLNEEREKEADVTRATLSAGSVVTGKVTSLKPYGAFVDIGGLEGMLHVSELGHTRVEDPSEVLHVGQDLKVVVLKVEQTGDKKRPEKISLSLKSLAQDPWQNVESQFPVGSQQSGAVVRVQPFGVFVELSPGVEGLVHISEMGGGRRLSHPREVAVLGQAVSVTVLSMDLEKRRISLSMDAAGRQAQANEEAEAIAEHKSGAPKTLGTFADLLKGR